MTSKIDSIRGKKDFIGFLNLLAKDYKTHNGEWVNQTVPDFLERIASWIEDYSECPLNDVEWDGLDFKILARIFYMGKIYE